MDATEKRNRPTRRRLVLMRHGDVSYFDENGRPFRPDAVSLNAEGRSQAAAAARELAAVPFDRVLASDLPRCVETATLVTAGRGLTLETRAELREIQPGRLRDIPPDDLQRQFVGAFGEALNADTRFLAGETFGSLLGRVTTCFRGLLQDPTWRCLLVVAHGGVNRAILCEALGLGLAGFASFEQDTCCINILDVEETGRCLIRLVNHTPYNSAKVGLELTTMERLFLDYQRRRRTTGESREEPQPG
jgi:probable phosphoglycerate mutase